MKEFPQMHEYSNDDLIIIVYGEKDLWQKDAITYAKKLLSDRGVSEENCKLRFKEIQEIISENWREEMKRRKDESFSPFEIIWKFFFLPRAILYDWDLKKNGYERKWKQRLFLIGASILFYAILLFSVDLSFRQEMKREKELFYQDSVMLSKADWSGKYSFRETNGKETVNWLLEVSKQNNKHKARLTLNNDKLNQVINCSCELLENEIEFYPDTLYNVFGKVEIAYYDILFSLVNKDSVLLTNWSRLKPFELTDYESGNIFFEKINNP